MNMRNLLLWFSIAVVSSSFIACEKEVDWQSNSEQSDAVVVECVLTNEYKYQEVRLSQPKSNVSDRERPISQASVLVNDGLQDYIFTELDSVQGLYMSQDKFSASVSKAYRLEIGWGDRNFQAETLMSVIKPFNLLSISLADKENFYEVSYVSSLYDTNEQALYEISIFSDSVITEVDTSQSAKLFYYTFSTLDVGEVFAPTKGECIFYKGAKIIEKKYSLTKDYAEFVKAMASETEWQGSFFAEASSNLPSNIEGDNGLGYFTACTVLIDSLIVN